VRRGCDTDKGSRGESEEVKTEETERVREKEGMRH
jgi:hypothetical protein